jgi:1-deoxy-D-xylulose-5-phosphate synthase
VINSRFSKPLDNSLIIETAHRTKHIITVEENVLSGGLGSRVVSLLQNSGLYDIYFRSIGITDEFVEHGTQSILREKYSLDPKGIVRLTLNLLKETKSHPIPEMQVEKRVTPI